MLVMSVFHLIFTVEISHCFIYESPNIFCYKIETNYIFHQYNTHHQFLDSQKLLSGASNHNILRYYDKAVEVS